MGVKGNMKTLTSILSLFLLASTAVYAQDKKPAPKPPVLTADQKLEFFKAQAEFTTASSQAKDANQNAAAKQTALQGTIKVITDACGKDFVPNIDAGGYPVCQAKPTPASEVKK